MGIPLGIRCRDAGRARPTTWGLSALFFLPDQSVATSQNLKHDLVGASADRVEPTVAEEPGSPRLFHVTHSAMELEARIGDLTRESARHELRNSRLSDDEVFSVS